MDLDHSSIENLDLELSCLTVYVSSIMCMHFVLFFVDAFCSSVDSILEFIAILSI